MNSNPSAWVPTYESTHNLDTRSIFVWISYVQVLYVDDRALATEQRSY